jgi:hypothetical protein
VLSSDSARKKVLGISVGERALLVAEVAADGAEAQVLRVASFAFPKGVGFDQPENLGSAFKEFLHGNAFKCRRAVFGVPAKWLILKPQNLPPVDAEAARSMLAMQAETQCPPELGAMVFDYAGQSSPTHASSLLLMGLAQKYIDRLSTIAHSAGLKAIAITSSAAALGAATARRVESPLVLSLRADGAELSAQEGNQTRYIRHLGAISAVSGLAVEMRRAAATLPNGWGMGNGHPQIGGQRALVLWDDVGLGADALSALEASLQMPVIRGQISNLGRIKLPTAETCVGASAVALALPALRGQRPPVDFLHPRLAPSKPKTVPRHIVWSSIAAAAVVLCFIGGYGDILILHHRIQAIDRELQAKDAQLKIARPYVASMQFAEAFHTGNPRHLACLADVTAALPPDGQTYLTSFQLKTNMRGEISGHSTTPQNVTGLAERLGRKFADIHTRLDSRDVKGTNSNNGVSYNISFTYVAGAADPPAVRVAAAK